MASTLIIAFTCDQFPNNGEVTAPKKKWNAFARTVSQQRRSEMPVPKFWIESPDGDEERLELFVGETNVGSFNHDEHGWQGMNAAKKLFERTAKAVGAAFERR